MSNSTDWRTSAACRARGVHPDAMFPERDKERIDYARTICAGCPVSMACLRDAINSGDTQWGIRGGLTPEERRAVKKEINRRLKAAEETQAAGKKADPALQRKSCTSLGELFEGNTKRLVHGHLTWTGPARLTFQGQVYSPRKVAFIVDRGRPPSGRVMTTCGLSGCVQPAHIADDEERTACGTRGGYQRHYRQGTEVCGPCRQANTDADNRLRRTGTSKQVAA
ncbi:WhiB family transcriptional regulator [Streptomyces sp. NPDC001544]|uniref:WhiB family transcriptional regulator n=1 Tax=Streptomyces sp. NPDC001544 TaxID=3364584 RepID=UPI00368197C4